MPIKEFQNKIDQISKIGSYVTDLTKGTWVGSENFISIFGLEPKKEYSIEEFQALVHPDDFDEVMAYFGECLVQKKNFDYQYRCIRNNGEVIYIHSKSQVHYAEDGTPLKITGVKQNITAEKLKELELSNLLELNQKKNDDLNAVAHDLRAPISQIEGVVGLLSADLTDEQNELVDLILTSCKTSKAIIEDLIKSAKKKDNTETLEKILTEINGVVKHSLRRFQIQAGFKEIQFKTEFDDDYLLNLNPEKLIRAFDNILSNAIKFSHQKGEISIKTKKENNGVSIHFKDCGIGIPKELIPKLFLKMESSVQRTGTSGEQSTGLGLSIAKNVIDQHNGSINVLSEEGKGTHFHIFIPEE